MERKRSLAPRDQATSAFSTILMRLVDGCDASAAVLVDPQGETVDYAGTADVFAMKVAAAEWRLVLQIAQRSGIPGWNDAQEIHYRGANKSYAVVALSEGYALVLELLPRAFGVSERAVVEAVLALEVEAALGFADGRRAIDRWARVEVQTEKVGARRPRAVWVGGHWTPVVILGSYRLGRADAGYRARLPSGEEITLVREPLGRWYADVLPEGG